MTNVEFEIKKVLNGYTVSKGWTEKKEDLEFSEYKREIYIFVDYEDVIAFLSEAKF